MEAIGNINNNYKHLQEHDEEFEKTKDKIKEID